MFHGIMKNVCYVTIKFSLNYLFHNNKSELFTKNLINCWWQNKLIIEQYKNIYIVNS